MNRADILILEKIKNFPIILVRTIWHNAIQELYKMLKEKIKDKLLSVIATSSEECLIFDSNVLVVVSDDSLDVKLAVVEAEAEVERRFNVMISPLIVTPKSLDIIKMFIDFRISIESSKNHWEKAIIEFYKLLKEKLKEMMKEILFAPSEDYLVFDSNVLVVVSDDSLDVKLAVVEAEAEVERRFNVMISPLIVTINADEIGYVKGVLAWRSLRD